MLDPAGQRRDAIAAFYARHHHQLFAATRARVRHVDDDVIQDACSHAWLQLVRRADIALNGYGLGWLRVTATHQAWHLAGTTRLERPSGSLITDIDPGEIPEPRGDAHDPLERTIEREEHQRRLDLFARLHPRHRRELFLQAAGHHYQEIAELTGTTYTAVNRWLTEGRAALRKLERATDE